VSAACSLSWPGAGTPPAAKSDGAGRLAAVGALITSGRPRVCPSAGSCRSVPERPEPVRTRARDQRDCRDWLSEESVGPSFEAAPAAQRDAVALFASR
jgi:hypothetical protein